MQNTACFITLPHNASERGEKTWENVSWVWQSTSGVIQAICQLLEDVFQARVKGRGPTAAVWVEDGACGVHDEAVAADSVVHAGLRKQVPQPAAILTAQL